MSALGEVIAQRVAAFRASQKLETNDELELERLYLRSLRRAVRGSLRRLPAALPCRSGGLRPLPREID
jgi:hypothetical protein